MSSINTLSDLLTACRSIEGPVQGVVAALKKQTEGRFHVSYNNEGETSRLIISVNNKYIDYTKPAHCECNGLVVEYPSWKILSVPPRTLDRRPVMSEVVDYITNGTVYEAADGTTVTLYWYGEKWCMSSANGIDVSHYKWTGPSTYFEAICSAAEQYGFDFDQLDKSKCHTIGFRFEDYHPLSTDPCKIWFVQSVDLAAVNEAGVIGAEYDNSHGLPVQPTLKTQLSGKQLSAWMLEKNSAALINYCNNPCAEEVHYGFVIRTDTRDILLESTLMHFIRCYVYNMPKVYRGRIKVAPESRIEYILLRVYLLNTPKRQFTQIFGQFADRFAVYDEIFGQLSNCVVQLLRNRCQGIATPSPQFKNKKLTEFTPKISALAAVLAEYIRNSAQINVMDAHGPGIVHDFIMTNKNLDMYFTYLFSGAL